MKLGPILNWITFLLVIAIGVYLIIFLKSESNACMTSPLQYGLKLVDTSNHVDFQCTCVSGSPYISNFRVSKDGIKAIEDYTSSNAQPVNFSETNVRNMILTTGIRK